MKTCKRCNVSKPESDFYNDKKSKDGLTRECKDCRKAMAVTYHTHIVSECKYCGVELEGRRTICDSCRETLKTRDMAQYHRDATRKWKDANPLRSWAGHSISCKKMDSRFTVTLTVDELVKKATTHCPLCGCELNYGSKGQGKAKVESCSPSLDRIDNSNIVSNDNTWVICFKCNATKSDRTLQEFIDYCKKIASYSI